MPRRKPKARPGIRRHGSGWQVFVRVNRRLITKQFPLDTPDAVMQDWRDAQRSARRRTRSGSFAADVLAYLATVQHMPTYHERTHHLKLWLDALGPDRPRATMTTTEIDAILSSWRTSGKKGQPLSATAVRHRRTALLHLFHRLDGKDAANPVRASWRPRDPHPKPRAISTEVLKSILKAIRGPKTRARLRVMAATGLPHKSLMQLSPEDIDWAHSRVMIQAREKGYGAPARWLPLNRHARFALRAMQATDAWGTFSPGGMRMTWRRALTRLKLPLTLRPYDVRHTVGTQLYATTGDLATVARLLGHADISTASRYSLDAHALTDADAMDRIGRRPKK